MFIDFSITNFGPFRNKAVFSLESTNLDGNEGNLLECDTLGEPLLGSAVIFGANASGKSYVLKAMEVLQLMVRAPMNPNITYPWYQPFRASSSTMSAPTELEIRFTKGGVKYDYAISFVADRVVSESLYHYPSRRKALVFMRSGQTYEFGRTAMKGLKASSALTSPASSFLAVAAQYNNETCLAAHQFIVNEVLIIGSNLSDMLNQVIEHINTHPESKAHMLRALKIADMGITDVIGSVQTRKATELGNEIPPQVIGLMMATGNTEIAQTTLLMEHRFPGSDVGQDMLRYPFGIESNGTMQLFCLMGPVIDALEKGFTVMIDEFGTFLHSDIARWIIRQFRSAANPNRAQLIVNTQDQSLLSLDILRRDQIWFTQKDMSTGASELYALSDFNGVRGDIDVQKSYSADKFGARPFIPDEDVMD
ncbi:MAG: ATP-binding protein [archaeon]|nr:ATP-binding protein [archaeon]